ncbi:MAG: cytochrome P450 [Polyangiales bacterium]
MQNSEHRALDLILRGRNSPSRGSQSPHDSRISLDSMLQFAPGERGLPLVGHLPWMMRDPMRFLAGLSRRYGNVAAFRMGTRSAVLVNDPELISRVLCNRSCTRSDESRKAMRSFLGDGLLTTEGPPHLRRRRMMAPSFHRDRIRSYTELMCAEAHADIAGWRPDVKRDLYKDMMRITFTIVTRALFSADRRDDAQEVEKALAVIMPWAMLGAATAGILPSSMPVIYPMRGKAAIARLNRLVLEIVAHRRAAGGDRGDVLSMLLATRDEDGSALTDQDICDEVLTLIVAGHDTTANTLTWAWHLLTQNPEVQEALYQEVHRVVGERALTPEDLPKLPLVEQVIQETLRLYPVIWIGDRVPQQDIELGGYLIPKGSEVVFSMYVTQRDERFFPDPERFDPSRFSPARIGSIPDGAYFPFGAGVHKCIGNTFALMEARIILAAMVQRFAISAIRKRKVRKTLGLVITPAGGLPVTLRERKTGVALRERETGAVRLA